MLCLSNGRFGLFLFVHVRAASVLDTLSKFLPGFLGQIRIIQTNTIEFLFLQLQESIMRTVNGTDDLIQLDLERLGIAILCILNQEHHQERDDRGPGVDNELPGVTEVEEGAGYDLLTMTAPAIINAEGRPVARDVVLAKFVNQEEDFVGLMRNLQVHSGSNMAMSTTSDSHTPLHARAAVERPNVCPNQPDGARSHTHLP
jgi:hypothetical protein